MNGPDPRQSRNAPRRRAGFTLTEMLVALAILLVVMTMAGTVFKVSMEGTRDLNRLSEINRRLRMFQDHLTTELAGVDPGRSIMAIQGNPAPAYWSHEQQSFDDDGNIFNGIAFAPPALHGVERENPTLGYDPLDADNDGSFDGDPNDNRKPQLPRADILMFISNQPQATSFVDPDIHSDGPVMIVYNHAELGELNPVLAARPEIGPVCSEPGQPSNMPSCDSTDDWFDRRPIPQLTSNASGPLMDTTSGVQDIAQDWHLARRAILLKSRHDHREDADPNDPDDPPREDRHAHVLSPTNPAGNRQGCVGFLESTPPPACSNQNTLIDQKYERHYLNWILGGEMDVVSPVHPPDNMGQPAGVSGLFFPITLQDFNFNYEITRRFFGSDLVDSTGKLITLDRLIEDPNDDGTFAGVVRPGSVRNVAGFWRGGVPAFWLARSHLDPEPPLALSHRLGHYFLPNCASFKVEWTPNDIQLEQAGLPEILWIDPFKEPGAGWPTVEFPPNFTTAPPPLHNTITPTGVTKPLHLDEFEIMAQKMSPDAGVPLSSNTVLGNDPPGPFGPEGSPLLQVKLGLIPRFGMSISIAGATSLVLPAQANAFDADPTTPGVQPSHNTHSWYARDLVIIGGSPKTLDRPDRMWPKALRITVDLFNDGGFDSTLKRAVFIVPVGRRGGMTL